MERRLLKDFQIGFVEGVVNEVIKSQDEPKDVFSKIAKAIGRKQGSKKDWNAEVRRRTTRRDPIGSTSESMRRSQQSLRRHIIQNENTALKNMDQEKLVQYNPKLNVVPPAARVAYAKFKMNKIKQEYDETGGDAAAEEDQVFKEGTDAKGKAAAPKPGDKPSVSSAAAAFRSRPQSKTVQDGTGTEGGAAAPSGSSVKGPAPPAPAAAKPEPPKPAPPKEPPKKPDSVVVDMEPKVEATKAAEAAKPPPPKPEPKPDSPKPKEEPKKEEPKKEEPKKEEPKKEEPKKEEKKPPSVKEPSPSSSPDTSAKSSSPAASEQSTIPARTPEPIRPGKSKVTGEVLTGWL